MREYLYEYCYVQKLYKIIHTIIYSFHMPAFFTISGIVFALYEDKYLSQSFQHFLAAKTKRLILPMLFACLAVDFPIKYFSGCYPKDNLWSF